MNRNPTVIAMSTTPCQTYLEERLQSARGLGWTVTPPAAHQRRETAAPGLNQASGNGGKGASPLLRWLGLAA